MGGGGRGGFLAGRVITGILRYVCIIVMHNASSGTWYLHSNFAKEYSL